MMKVTQERAEEANRGIVSSIETARLVVDHAYDEIEDEWYRSYLSDVGEVLYYVGRLVDRLNGLRFPVSPGKYAPVLNNVKRIMKDGPMTEDSIRGFLQVRGLGNDDIAEIMDYIHADPCIAEEDGGFVLKDDVSGSDYLDDRNMYDEDLVRGYCEEQAKDLGIDIAFVLCNNPFGDRIEVQIEENDTTRVCDVKEFSKRLRKEFGTYVNVNVKYDLNEILELS